MPRIRSLNFSFGWESGINFILSEHTAYVPARGVLTVRSFSYSGAQARFH